MTARARTGRPALFGGEPAFSAPRHVGAPSPGDRAALFRRIGEALDRRWLTNRGPLVEEFEGRIAARLGVGHCVAMCNGTTALEIAVRALGLSGEVILPSFTFVATAHALQWQRITPVFCDIEPDGYNIDPARIAALVTPRTTGIIGVHLFGRPAQVEALQRVADRHGLALLFDAAHAFGCTRRGRPVGGFGRCEVLSFHATKLVNSGEGGAVVTDDAGLARKVRLMQNFGFEGLDRVVHIGINGKMNEMAAAMGLTSLEAEAGLVETNRRRHETYRRLLREIPGLDLMGYDAREDSNRQYAIVEIDRCAAGLSRDQLVELLHAENVLARRYFHPGCHRMEPYRSLYPHAGHLLPRTERVCGRVLALPTGGAVSASDVTRICSLLDDFVAHAPEIRAGWAARPGKGGGARG
ncbi:MAG: DegT/DnrJ/EryC1/StrS family aminotransferase [Actinobacteria bacterium]|nr:DegT/DnrJ/EryC1/StrS family aminotransferase [bacterium]MBU1228272.1 DegT/DnrJ/EryC1/StrS family aminotransferase [Actinomycetota bacterium]